MSGFYKLLSKEREMAIAEIAGWDAPGLILSRDRLVELLRDIEQIQDHTNGAGQAVVHILWEQVTAYISSVDYASAHLKKGSSQPSASPNGGSATQPANSEPPAGPPSVT